MRAPAQPHTAVTRSLGPAAGVTPARAEGPKHKFLSDAIVARGLVTQKEMNAALEEARTGPRYSEILVASGLVSEDDLSRVLAEHHRIDHVDLDVFPVDPGAAALLPTNAARRFGAVPIALLPTGEAVLALHDPEALTNIVELSELIGRHIVPVVAARSQVERYIESDEEADSSPSLVSELARPVAPVPAPVPDPPVSVPFTLAPAVAAPPEAEAPTASALIELLGRLTAAERRADEAEERMAAAEARLRDAEERAAAAHKHAEGMAAAAQAANEALAQLAEARAAADQLMQTRMEAMEAVSQELRAERAERRRLEEDLRRRAEERLAAAPAQAPAAPAAPAEPAIRATVAAEPHAPVSAPPPGVAQPAPRSMSAKARGVRRMIAALRGG